MTANSNLWEEGPRPNSLQPDSQSELSHVKSDPTLSILGLDVGGSKTAVVEGTGDARILQRREISTESEWDFRDSFPRIAGLLSSMAEEARLAGRTIGAVSVAIGGPLRIEEGILLDPPHLPGWHGIHLKKHLEVHFPGLPVLLEDDGAAGALAEFHFGVGRDRPDLRHLVFLTFGTGLGAGLIVDGRVVRGASGTAGEVGHIRLSPEGPVSYGKAGSWEGFASGTGMVLLASRMFPARWKAHTPVRELVDAMLADDAEALAVAAEVGKWLGRGMAVLVDILNPQIIVLGSLAVALGERVLAPARSSLAEEALPQAAAACQILPSALGKNLGDVASLMAALTRLKNWIPHK